MPTAAELETLRSDAAKTPLESYRAGIAHYIRREYDDAERAFLRAQGDQSLAPFAFNRQANVQRVTKKYDDAVALYMKSIELIAFGIAETWRWLVVLRPGPAAEVERGRRRATGAATIQEREPAAHRPAWDARGG